MILIIQPIKTFDPLIRILTWFFQYTQWRWSASINPLFGGSETKKNVTSNKYFCSAQMSLSIFSPMFKKKKNSQVFYCFFFRLINNPKCSFRSTTVFFFICQLISKLMHNYPLFTAFGSFHKLSFHRKHEKKNRIRFSSKCWHKTSHTLNKTI